MQVDQLRLPVRFLGLLGVLFLGLGVTIPAARGQSLLYYDRSTFLADARVTAAASIHFDDLTSGTVLNGSELAGVNFASPSGSQLIVMPGNAGVRYGLAPSTAPNVLSPGGSDAGIEEDDLELVFSNPTAFFGLDVVLDDPDGASYVGVTFYDAVNNVLDANGFIPAPAGAPGYQFVGLVTDSPLIKRVVFDEFDPTPPDDHVAYDSLIMAVPEPSSIVLIGLGLVAMGSRLRRRV